METNMKRFAILLNCVDGILSSGKDASDMYHFLRSLQGGAWEDGEICSKENISLMELCEILDKVRNSELDYLFFYFSGHGGSVRETELELNTQGESISERFLSGLAKRQLNIYDCCRTPITASFSMNSRRMIKESSESLKQIARKRFNERIMEAAPQQMSLYACSIGQKAYDSGKGGFYTQNLLTVARASDADFLLASQAHSAASELTRAALWQKGLEQTPDYFMAKLPSRHQIPIALNII